MGHCWDERTIVEAIMTFQEFADVFSFNYQNLKGNLKEYIKLKITLHHNVKSIQHKYYRMHPKHKKKIGGEINKMLDLGIIYSIQ